MENNFAIPELPSGHTLYFVFLTSWGDPNFVGINTIELFNANGERPDFQSIETNATETIGDLENILYAGHFLCTDPLRMWSARYDILDKDEVRIKIQLKTIERLAMIRIWNYSECRVHSLRGVRHLRIDFDNQTIFRGEISCAYTNESGEYPLGDTILFTTDEEILENIANNDICFAGEEFIMDNLNLDKFGLLSISSKNPDEMNSSENSFMLSRRPTTGDRQEEEKSTSNENLDYIDNSGKITLLPDKERASEIAKTNVFQMELYENWGAPDCIGLTGLQFLGSRTTVLDIKHCLATASTGLQTAQKLLNGRNLTGDRDDMWLVPHTPDLPPPCITITFPEPLQIIGVSIWNYNASPEMSYAGVRLAKIYLNGKALDSLILLRKAPGEYFGAISRVRSRFLNDKRYVLFDFVQDIFFDNCDCLFRPLPRPNTSSLSGFIYQLQLYSTWGDEFYIGLNGIEFYSHLDSLIPLRAHNLAAFPESVNVLPGVNADPRTSENLINGENDTDSMSNIWLTPMLPNHCARIFVVFDIPTFVSQIVIYNYRKTPERGVRHLSVSVDDLIVFSGEVPTSTTEKTGILRVSLRE
ncbi:unnamed protein product [Dracunculus medinensis]|uniref:DUF4457 domain-containing protein n=1 Tax=Dracunculus medinensis TaxID=318479 RepID=A0A0N4U8H0_DRAME|nr:unnamed protein product [Dracunculus medinensis]